MDAFERLGMPRRPWVDADTVRRLFHERSGPIHPDRHHTASETVRAEMGQRYAELNEAHQILREPRERLLHLLELETGGKPKDIQKIPPGTMDLFVEVGQTCRDCDEHLRKQSGAVSPILRLQLMQAGLDWVERMESLAGRVRGRGDELEAELRSMNAAWESAPAPGAPGRAAALPLERLEQIYRAMSYVSRWMAQIQERVVQLAT